MAPVNSRARNSSRRIVSWKVAVKPVQFKKPKSSGPIAKQIFRGKFMSLAGTFTDTSGNTISHERIAGWITHHGGVVEGVVNSSTSHLICSIDEYKKESKQVQNAWKLGTNRCHIVVLDWIEDCLLGKQLKKRLLVERGYTLDRTIARLKKGKTNHATLKAKFEEGVRASEELCDNRLHHVFYDQTGFEYKVMLTRINSNGRSIVQRYTIFLFESHAIPHTYMCGAKFTCSHRPTTYYRDQCHPKDFPSALSDFKHIFRVKTGSNWNVRLEKMKFGEEEREHYFIYTPPVLGRPVGLLPRAYKRPEEREELKVEGKVEEEVYGIGYGLIEGVQRVDSNGVQVDVGLKEESQEGKGIEAESGESEEDVVYDTD